MLHPTDTFLGTQIIFTFGDHPPDTPIAEADPETNTIYVLADYKKRTDVPLWQLLRDVYRELVPYEPPPPSDPWQLGGWPQ